MDRIRVLIVDDSAVIRRLLSDLLKEDPHLEVVGMAGNGEQAIPKVQQLHPDVITLDMEMPVMDGMTALRQLRQAQGASRPDTPVIMVTAYAMSFDRQRFLDAGADGYVSKPIDAQALQAEIHRLLPQFVSAAA